MGAILGERQYKKFLRGQKLTRKEAMLAMCYVCNGENESRVDCQGYSCPLYQYAPYRGRKVSEVCAEPCEKPRFQG